MSIAFRIDKAIVKGWIDNTTPRITRSGPETQEDVLEHFHIFHLRNLIIDKSHELRDKSESK